MTVFSTQLINIINSIPKGRVSSYGRIAEIAGNPRAARQVSRLLHSSSEKYGLPWHRVIGSSGNISLKGAAADLQRQLLESEGIEFDINGKVDMDRYGI
ncbi:MAG: MGMT family protein [Spirochaetales bacterium]|nr:MGMT family protein [Spirochaetales bacterium]